ncbi:MAG: T9SS type A sorting domain-containing protein [Flavobacteriales bacterium]|nr:T9SS type A sorting domain-containing protein [Flavobacteriales bacterium]
MNRLKSFILLTVVLVGTRSNAQQFDWVKTISSSGSTNDVSVSDMEFDNTGSLLICGNFWGDVDLDPGPGAAVFNTGEFTDLYVSKYNEQGEFEWAWSAGSHWWDNAGGIGVDATGSVYFTGTFTDSIDMDPGPSVQMLFGIGLSRFLCKIDVNGELVWARIFNGQGYFARADPVLDQEGNIYLTGYFSNTFDFDLGLDTTSLTAVGNWDAYTVKYNSMGELLWVQQMSGNGREVGRSLLIDNLGNNISTGYFSDTMYFQIGGVQDSLISVDGYDGFVTKRDGSGELLWIVQLGGPGSEFGRKLETDPSGNIYVTGQFELETDFDTGTDTFNLQAVGEDDGFILKLNPDGNLIWAKQYGGNASYDDLAISTDEEGNLYTTGRFFDTPDFDPGPSIFNLTSNGDSDAFVSKLDSMGNLIWTKQIGGTGNGEAREIVVKNGSVFTVGVFSNSFDFDPGPDTYYLNSVGGDNVFIHKMNICDITTASRTAQGCDGYVTPNGEQQWYASGSYINIIPNSVGCDSVITTEFTLIERDHVNIDETACYAYTSASGNHVWTESGVYTDTVPNMFGCDSIITVNLTINTSYGEVTVSACDSYTSPSGNNVWTENGSYSDTVPNSIGCDSVLTINLTFNNTQSSTIRTECQTYTSPSGNYVWTESGIYSDTIQNSFDCDEVVTINLTILEQSSDTISVTLCQSYISPSGNYTWTTDGPYTDTLINAVGCDSILIIGLTLTDIDNAIAFNVSSQTLFSLQENATYQWLDCDNSQIEIIDEQGQSFTPFTNGNFAVAIATELCTDTSDCFSFTGVGILENSFANAVSIYPNPTNAELTIDLGETLQNFTLNIWNAQGKLVSSKVITSAVRFTTDIVGNADIYLIELTDEDGTRTSFRVVKK